MGQETSGLVSACFSALQHRHTSIKCCLLICLSETLFPLQKPCSVSYLLSETMTMQFSHPVVYLVKDSETSHAWSKLQLYVMEQNISICTQNTGSYCTNTYMHTPAVSATAFVTHLLVDSPEPPC